MFKIQTADDVNYSFSISEKRLASQWNCKYTMDPLDYMSFISWPILAHSFMLLYPSVHIGIPQAPIVLSRIVKYGWTLWQMN